MVKHNLSEASLTNIMFGWKKLARVTLSQPINLLDNSFNYYDNKAFLNNPIKNYLNHSITFFLS
jgi:hypothetical protein